jgi:uncharacterized lipoprotein YajG
MSRIVALSSIMIVSIMMMVGCASLPQRLVIQPSIQTVADDSIADHQEISLRVIDSRTENDLGYLEDGEGNRQPFLSTQELDMVIDKAIAAGLRKKGFIPLAGVHENNISLTVVIQEFSHRVSPGIVKVPVQTKISLRTSAVNGGRKLTTYHSIDKQAVLALRPGIQQNQRLVNEALTAVLEKIFQDRKMFNVLVSNSGTGMVK